MFSEIKQKVMTENQLSSNAFCRAVRVIESHREFSLLIGIELPLIELKPDIFLKLREIKQAGADLNTVSIEEWAALAAVYEVGRENEFSEKYNWYAKYLISDDYEGFFSPADIMRDVFSRNNRFSIGLQKLGQKTLHAAFIALFPQIVPSEAENAASRIAFERHLSFDRPA